MNDSVVALGQCQATNQALHSKSSLHSYKLPSAIRHFPSITEEERKELRSKCATGYKAPMGWS